MQLRELVTGVYAWDLADEGVETVLGTAQERMGINSVYLVGLMHYEKRPFSNYAYYPHNPVRKEYLAEDSRAYWLPAPTVYAASRIKPITTERDFLKGTDWLDVLAKEARRRGLRVGVEISHTPLDLARSESEFPDVVQRDIFGNRFPGIYAKALCPYNEDARAYVYSLAYDLTKNHDVDMLQSCMLLFHPGRPDLHSLFGVALGGCFCPSCERAARAEGLDWDKIKRTARRLADVTRGSVHEGGTLEDQQYALKVKGGSASDVKLLLELPELYEWMRFRVRGVVGIFKSMRDGAKAGNPNVDFRFNNGCRNNELFGLDLGEMATFCDSVRVTTYEEQTGSREIVEQRKPATLINIRREIGNDVPLIASVATRPEATVDLIKLGIRIAGRCGVDGISLAFYDGASFDFMDAVRDGLKEAGLTVAR